jgi:hypothetical protein
MPKYVILNGPPKSGKDTIGQALHAQLTFAGIKVHRDKFAKPIKDAVAAFIGLEHDMRQLYFENPSVKDASSKYFFGKTPREVLISFSEDWVKKQFGEQAFGELLKLRTEELGEDVVIITDCGFNHELEPFDVTDLVVIRLHREGCDYSRDSRSYITREDIFVFDIDNNEEPDYVAAKVINKLRKEGFLNVPV